MAETAEATVAIVGPTGAGKSATALEVAERLDAEIVAVDAFTVYRGMDVGTAKPSPAERGRVRHHMIDVLDPTQGCTVQWFQRAARAAIAGVRDRGRLPLLVGGSGLYFRAVVDPLEFPPTDPVLRTQIQDRYRTQPAEAHAALVACDPAAAARIDPGNVRRVVRALEVVALTGRPFSDWRRAWDRHESIYSALVVIGLELEPEALRRRLDARVDRMLADGLVDECRGLARQELSRTARQAIGYAEALELLAGTCSLDQMAERIKVRTRQYAAKQRRWFHDDPRVGWTSPTAHDIFKALRHRCGL